MNDNLTNPLDGVLPRITVAQVGARRHYAIPKMLHEAGMLEHFYTDICAVTGWPRLLNLIPHRYRTHGLKKLLGRVPEHVPKQLITTFARFGMDYYLRRRRSGTRSEIIKTVLWGGEEFCQHVLKHEKGGFNGIYTFNGAGLELLRHARQKGVVAIMEQTIAPMKYERQLMVEEQRQFPDWQLPEPNDKWMRLLIEREMAEWEMAGTILCGSEFVRKAIIECGGPADKCEVIPYGIDPLKFAVPARVPHEGVLRVLTVGVAGLRKGSPYVLEAAKQMKGVATFRMVGSVSVQAPIVEKLRNHLELLGPVPRSEMLEQFRWADVFLLPSLCEGSAVATYEALAAGLPVICTPNTGSVVSDKVNGFIVPTYDARAIVDRLICLAERPDVLQAMSLAASDSANEISLTRYQQRLVEAVQRSCDRHGVARNVAC